MDFKTLANTELIELCAEAPRNEQAWTEFCARFDGHIRLMILRECREKQFSKEKPQFAEIFEDLVQEVYLKLVQKNCKALREFKASTANAIFAYLAIIARNVVRSHFTKEGAKKRRARLVSLEAPAATSAEDGELRVIDTIPSPDPGPEAGLDQESQKQELENSLDTLLTGKSKTRDKLIFKLYWFEKFSPEQISAYCGIGLSPKRIINIISGIKKRLAAKRHDFEFS
ncbi:sigma-70 family RNA polymerase sigma factor [bacterium]|nr:sigma-70 family RNA polymerase sigma factor [bacterium]